jgi:hypothetical protein
MLKLTDSGCAQHSPQPITFTGVAAVLVGRLILNLSPTAAGPTYICEHGHTHRLTLHQCEEKLASGLTGPDRAVASPPSINPDTRRGETSAQPLKHEVKRVAPPDSKVQTPWRRA